MKKEDIATRIRKHYNSEDGEWIIQAGKMKEAKLLKEACETIESLTKKNIRLQNTQAKIWSDNNKHDNEVREPLEEKIIKLQKDLKLETDRIAELRNAFKSVNNIFEATYFSKGYW